MSKKDCTPIEEKHGLGPGVLVRAGLNHNSKSPGTFFAFPVSCLENKTPKSPASLQYRWGLANDVSSDGAIRIMKGDFIMYLSRVPDRGAWLVYSPKHGKRFVITNRNFWKCCEVVSVPEIVSEVQQAEANTVNENVNEE